MAAVGKVDAGRVTEARASSADQEHAVVVVVVVVTSDVVTTFSNTTRVVLSLAAESNLGAAAERRRQISIFSQRQSFDVLPSRHHQQHRPDQQKPRTTHCGTIWLRTVRLAHCSTGHPLHSCTRRSVWIVIWRSPHCRWTAYQPQHSRRADFTQIRCRDTFRFVPNENGVRCSSLIWIAADCLV